MPNITYTRGIPASSHNPSTDQPDMQINNDSIDDLISVDHYGFNDNNGGFHKVIDLVNQIAIPALPSGVGMQLYSGANNLIFKNAQIPMGTFLTNSNAPPIIATTGSTFLAGGMIMEWGGGLTDINGIFNEPFPYPFSTIYSVVSGINSLSTDFTVTQFTLGTDITLTAKNQAANTPIPGIQVWWIAIGVI